VPRHGKRFQAARSTVDSQKRHSIEEAVSLVKNAATAKFDESVDVAVRLGVNPRQADQMVRGAVSLPHGIGKTNVVVVFAEGDAAKAAEEAGADYVGSTELINKIAGGWMDFDKAVATRSMMAKVGRLGRVLGPRGLMPNPKTGTVVSPDDVGRVVSEVKSGRIDFRVERAGIVHTQVGKASMTQEQLQENVLALISTLLKLKPSTAKGTYIRGVALSSTMGPGVRLDSNEVTRQAQDFRG